jgi:hypothetical protein
MNLTTSMLGLPHNMAVGSRSMYSNRKMKASGSSGLGPELITASILLIFSVEQSGRPCPDLNK